MKMQWIAIVLFVGFSSSSMAAEQDYRLCTVGGYFSGTQDKFLSGLVAIFQKRKKSSAIPYVMRHGKMHSESEKNYTKQEGFKIRQREK